MRRRTRIRRSSSLIGTARLELERGTASALLGELEEARQHGKRAGRLILEAIREAQCAHIFTSAPRPALRAVARQLGGGTVNGMAALEDGSRSF